MSFIHMTNFTERFTEYKRETQKKMLTLHGKIMFLEKYNKWLFMFLYFTQSGKFILCPYETYIDFFWKKIAVIITEHELTIETLRRIGSIENVHLDEKGIIPISKMQGMNFFFCFCYLTFFFCYSTFFCIFQGVICRTKFGKVIGKWRNKKKYYRVKLKICDF